MAHMHIEAALSVSGRPSPLARKVMIEILVKANLGKAPAGAAVSLPDVGAAVDVITVQKHDSDTLTAREEGLSVTTVPDSATTWWTAEHRTELAIWLGVLIALLTLGIQLYTTAGGQGAPKIYIQIVHLPGPPAP
jgi:hypothetical protein